MIFIIAMLSSNVFAKVYFVKPGDTLSGIVSKQLHKSIFRDKTVVHLVRTLNPNIEDVDLIFPGQKILFPDADELTEPISQAEEKTVPVFPPPVFDEPNQSEREPVSDDSRTSNRVSSTVGVEAGFEFFRIDSKDIATNARVNFLSNMSPQLRIGWDLKWTPEWTTRLQFNYLAQQILPDDRIQTVTLEKSESPRYAFLIGAERNWSESQRTGLFLNYKERMFSHSQIANVIVMDRIGSQSIKLSHQSDFLQHGGVRFGLGASTEYIFTAAGPGYSTKAGYGGDVNLYLKHQMTNFNLLGSFYYGVTQQNSEITEQKESHLCALMGVSWNFTD